MKNPLVKFEKKLDLGSVKYVLGDSNRLTQLINNFLSNAMKFTSEGQITFTASVGRVDLIGKKVEIVFSCKDTGIGIDEAGLSRLFKPFSQVWFPHLLCLVCLDSI